MKSEKWYTAGEMAKFAGVSPRTIRFYDIKGILKPVACSEAGYRYYDRDSIVRLQRILMLKYLGFSLQQITEMVEGETDLDTQLSQQKNLLRQRKQQLEEMIGTIEILEKSKEEEKWDYLLRLLNLLSDDEKIKRQYEKADNLERRIKLHDYSTASQDWMDWVYERLPVKPGGHILEIGCGNGMLWQKNIEKLPSNLHLRLTDQSEGMLEQAHDNLKPYESLFKEKQIHVEYQVMDANRLRLSKENYDCIIANHMLYHVENREECLKEIAKALKPTGTFVCTTIGERHMEELHEMVAAFDSRIEMPYKNLTKGFRLENGRPQLEKFFSAVVCERQENDLLVDQVDAIYDYVYSYPGNAPCILEQRGGEFREMLRELLEKEGAIYIRKDTGMFLCYKSLT
ncbi:MAG: MerR family transcriptional regulator [Candidatus Gastranaerophilales bacterium]|nr:MerR family transcriptional regulator [Candidatus Gastranaerophilales bacterium]